MANTPNINWGTEFDDGLRVGPSFPNLAAFKIKGPGAQIAPVFGQEICAKAGGGVGTATAQAGGGTPLRGVGWFLTSPGGGYAQGVYARIPLAPGGGGGALVFEPNFSSNIQLLKTDLLPGMGGKTCQGLVMDHPRALVYASSAASANTQFIAVGLDMYGQPMMEITAAAAGGGAIFVAGKKAFAQVIACYVVNLVGAIAAGINFSVSVSNVFGVPYFTSNPGGAISVTAAGGVAALTVGTCLGGVIPSVAVANDTAGGGLGDPRGTFAISAADYAADITVGLNYNITMMFYANGFAANLNQDAELGVSDGLWTVSGNALTLSGQRVQACLPQSLYTQAAYPYFGCVTTADTQGTRGTIKAGPTGQYPCLPNVVYAYGAQHYWGMSTASALARVVG